MFHRSGSQHSKREITAPPNDLANRLQHPPPALLLAEQKLTTSGGSSSSSVRPGSKSTKQYVQRNKSYPVMDTDEKFTASYEVSRSNRSESPSSGIPDKRKKKNVFSFLKKKSQPAKDEPDFPPNQRLLSRTPDSFGRKQISNYHTPGSVPPIRRPHSAASDRVNSVNVHNRSMRERRYIQNDEDEFHTPHYKPVRIAPPIPFSSHGSTSIKSQSQVSYDSNGGYDSLEKYRQPLVTAAAGGSSSGGTQSSSVNNDSPSIGVVSTSTSTSTTTTGLNYISTSSTSVPGLIGIKNHGNTCFMNSVIQCLSNTEPLLNYFLANTYKTDLLTSKKKSTRKSHSSLNDSNDRLATPLVTVSGQADVLPSPSSEGAITEYIGLLLKSLWNAQYEGKVSAFVREVISLWGQQYRGNNQHDAQEFLLWLLDHLHEELNQATGERMTRSPCRKANEEEELAAETLSDHLQRHDSLIYNLFSAQYHSSLHCPGCNHLSNTFDPYLCVSLSVPRRGSRPIYITMARRHQNTTRLMVFGMSLKTNATVRDIQRQLSVEARTLPHYLVIGDMKQDGFYRFFRPNDPISAITDYCSVYAYEVTPHRGEFTPALPNPSVAAASLMNTTNNNSETIFLILQCRVGQGEYSKKFGSPMCLRVWRDLTYSQLQSVVFKHMRKYLHDGVNPEVVCRDYIFFKCLVLDGLQGQEYLDPYCPSPFMCPSVEKALSDSKMWGYEPHIKVIAEWEQWVKDTVCMEIPDASEDPVHPSVHVIKDHYSTPLEASLDDCLEWHTKEEKLDDDETYRCHHCGKPQAGATKRISFWTLPDIMVIHLKRFEVDEYNHSKLNTLIRYPVRGLDMTPYLARPDQSRPSSAMGFRDHLMLLPTSQQAAANKTGSIKDSRKSSKSSLEKQPSSSTLPLKNPSFEELRKTPKDHAHPKSKQKFVWKKPKKSKKSREENAQSESPNVTTSKRESNLYDLYAVCDHHGSIDSGHYISHCCNPVDGRWYTYDDHRVIPVSSLDHLVNQNAYVLFYMRRGAKSRYLLQQMTTGNGQHWIQKLLNSRIDLSRIIASLPDSTFLKAQRQGSVASAQTLSTVSGVSPDNMAITSPIRIEHAPPTGQTHHQSPPLYHTHQLSNGSSGGGVPPLSPQSTMGYPQSLPSPSAQSSVSYFSQPSAFTNRIGSFHGHSRLDVQQTHHHHQEMRTATRL